MKRNTLVISGAALLTAAALGLGGAALANAGQAASGAVAAGGYGMGGDRHGPGRHGGWFGASQGVAGEETVNVVETAVAKEPTAVLMRIGKASDGTYRVSMRRTDGTHIVLTLDANFAVTGTEERVRRQPKPSTPSSSTTT